MAPEAGTGDGPDIRGGEMMCMVQVHAQTQPFYDDFYSDDIYDVSQTCYQALPFYDDNFADVF